jgi:hypothetical protein
MQTKIKRDSKKIGNKKNGFQNQIVEIQNLKQIEKTYFKRYFHAFMLSCFSSLHNSPNLIKRSYSEGSFRKKRENEIIKIYN